MSDPVESTALSLATFLSDDARGYSREVTATVPEDIRTELKRETSGLRVLVSPVGFSEEKENRGKVFATLEINVIVTESLRGKTRKELADFAMEVRQSLRFEKQNGYVWRGTETLTHYDAEIFQQGQYLSAFKVIYEGII